MKSLVLAVTLAASATHANPPAVKPALAGVAFLVGDWTAGEGVVADTGGASKGSSRITVVANGGVLLRQDKTMLFDKTGKPTGGFDQVMMIYPESGALHADYSDGSHVIHYTQAEVVPGRSVTFLTSASPGAPVFRLAYTLTDPATLAVAFAMAAPGGTDFHPIATGTLKKSP